VKSAADTRRIMKTLERQHPDADTELDFATPYELLVATILSAQCTDERVNQVTPALFKRYPNAAALHTATTGELEPQIQSTGFFRAKSKSLAGMAAAVCERHHGEIPATMEELTRLPGVGRKTANVVLGHALGVPGLPVDRHVLRVSNRIGIARGDDPEVVEQQLCAAMPKAKWTKTSDTLIIHGRRICKPKPLCDQCSVRQDCDYFRQVVSRFGPRRQGTGHRSAKKPQGTGKATRKPQGTSKAAESSRKPQGTGNPAASSRKPHGTGNATASSRKPHGTSKAAESSRKPQGTGNPAATGRNETE
jgi:endonuclease-3